MSLLVPPKVIEKSGLGRKSLEHRKCAPRTLEAMKKSCPMMTAFWVGATTDEQHFFRKAESGMADAAIESVISGEDESEAFEKALTGGPAQLPTGFIDLTLSDTDGTPPLPSIEPGGEASEERVCR